MRETPLFSRCAALPGSGSVLPHAIAARNKRTRSAFDCSRLCSLRSTAARAKVRSKPPAPATLLRPRPYSGKDAGKSGPYNNRPAAIKPFGNRHKKKECARFCCCPQVHVVIKKWQVVVVVLLWPAKNSTEEKEKGDKKGLFNRSDQSFVVACRVQPCRGVGVDFRGFGEREMETGRGSCSNASSASIR